MQMRLLNFFFKKDPSHSSIKSYVRNTHNIKNIEIQHHKMIRFNISARGWFRIFTNELNVYWN